MRVCVFCGSSPGRDPRYLELARALGSGLAHAGIGVVYGGGRVGLMGALADAALEAGGEVIGVIPRSLFAREVEHRGVTELHEVPDMHARKALMYDRADAFAVLPGGLGTLEELFEAATWNQLGLHDREKPIVLVDEGGHWDPLVELLDRCVDAGFVKPRWRATISRVVGPDRAVSRLFELAAVVEGGRP